MTDVSARHSTNGVRERALIVVCLLLIVALAWAYLLALDHRMAASARSASMMAEMGMPSSAAWGVAELVVAFSMWSVMMVGMMIPSAAPMLLLFANVHNKKREAGGPTLPLTLIFFGAGYLAVWIGFSGAASLAQWALHERAWVSASMAVASPTIAGALLIVAGVYQLTPLKRACLTRCQSPMAFLMTHWREGNGGALRMGLQHGIYCLGCCWALMCVLFAVGIMNLAWVAVLTVFILVEKFVSFGASVARVGGVMLVAGGILILIPG